MKSDVNHGTISQDEYTNWLIEQRDVMDQLMDSVGYGSKREEPYGRRGKISEKQKRKQ